MKLFGFGKKEKASKEGRSGRLADRLSRSSQKLGASFSTLFTPGRKLDAATAEELEELLILADMGPQTAAKIVTKLQNQRFNQEAGQKEYLAALRAELIPILEPAERPLEIKADQKPHIILFSGVNGAGKTTTLGKLAQHYKQEGLKVMVAAADTYRAAAVQQLEIWAERAGVLLVTGHEKSDPASVAYRATERAKTQGMDLLLIDTAGRLHNRAELMAELAKIKRSTQKHDKSAPHDMVLVIDATSGQNLIQQVKTFREMLDITGLIITKLDGSARGGVLVALADMFCLPIHAIGIGERIEDLIPFKAEDFVDALLKNEE